MKIADIKYSITFETIRRHVVNSEQEIHLKNIKLPHYDESSQGLMKWRSEVECIMRQHGMSGFLDDRDLVEAQSEANKIFYSMLHFALMDTPALSLIENIPNRNGFQAWNALCALDNNKRKRNQCERKAHELNENVSCSLELPENITNRLSENVINRLEELNKEIAKELDDNKCHSENNDDRFTSKNKTTVATNEELESMIDTNDENEASSDNQSHSVMRNKQKISCYNDHGENFHEETPSHDDDNENIHEETQSHDDGKENFHEETQSEDAEDEYAPLEPTDPLPSFPSTQYCQWEYNPKSRVILASFKIHNPLTIHQTDYKFLLSMMERDDISLVIDGLATTLDENLWNKDYLKDTVGNDIFHRFRTFINVNGVYEEKKGFLSMKIGDYVEYLNLRNDYFERGASEVDVLSTDDNSIQSQRKRSVENKSYARDEINHKSGVFTYHDETNKRKYLNYKNTVLYMIDLDIVKAMPSLFADLLKSFKLPDFLPGGQLL